MQKRQQGKIENERQREKEMGRDRQFLACLPPQVCPGNLPKDPALRASCWAQCPGAQRAGSLGSAQMHPNKEQPSLGRAPPGGLRCRGLGLGECPLLRGTVETTVAKGGVERTEQSRPLCSPSHQTWVSFSHLKSRLALQSALPDRIEYAGSDVQILSKARQDLAVSTSRFPAVATTV